MTITIEDAARKILEAREAYPKDVATSRKIWSELREALKETELQQARIRAQEITSENQS